MKHKVDNSYGIIPFYIPSEKIVEKSKGCYLYDSEGKTNEATKNAKEPLKQGQTQSTEKQAVFLKKLRL